MQHFIDACLKQASHARQTTTLQRLIAVPELHARFLNSLARLEYVGVRKMLKSRRAEHLDLEGLKHILEEAVHAVRLKKFALAVAPAGVSVETFSDQDTLAGDAAEDYFQTLDQAAQRELGKIDVQTCYWLTSTAIEIRARSFYPTYQRLLRAVDAPVSVQSIIADEEDHLQQMAAGLPDRVADWHRVLEAVMVVEEHAFCRYLDVVDTMLDDSARSTSAAR